MGGKESRKKGLNWERQVARDLSMVGVPHERVLTETREGNSGDVVSKRPKPEIPIAVVKQDYQKPVVVISWEDFLDLYYYVSGEEKYEVGFLCQCKVGKAPPVMPAYREAVEALDSLT